MPNSGRSSRWQAQRVAEEEIQQADLPDGGQAGDDRDTRVISQHEGHGDEAADQKHDRA